MSIGNFILKMAGLNCSACKYQLTTDDMLRAQSQMKAGVLVCPKCQGLVKSFNGNASYDKTNVIKTSFITHEQNQNGSHNFEVPWRTKMTHFLLFFGLFWSGIIGVITSSALSGSGMTINGVFTTDKTEILLALSLFVLIGVVMVATGFVNLINRRYITVNKFHISYTDGPIWLSGVKVFKTIDISNLSIRRKHDGRINERSVYSHVVELHLKQGSVVKLCSTKNKEDAIYIEQQIEKYLALKDQPELDEPLAS